VADLGSDLRAAVLLAKRNWKVLLLATVGSGVAAALASLTLPNTYTAAALILPPSRPQSIAASVLGQLGGMAGSTAPSLGFKDPAELYVGILGSTTSANAVIERLGLDRVYGAKNRTGTRGALLAHATFTIGRDSMIRIAVKDTDPKRAAAIANAFVAELNEQNSRLAITESAQRRLFFEREVGAERTALAEAEQHLAETQQRTGVVGLGDQAQAVIGSIAQIRARIAAQEASLRALQLGATAENPEVARQQEELSALRGHLAQLESGARVNTGDPLLPMTKVPKSGLEYARVLRDLKYHESLYDLLSRQFQAARIDEAKEAPVIQVLDPASPPEVKSGPPRAVMSALGAALGGVAAIIIVLLRPRSHP